MSLKSHMTAKAYKQLKSIAAQRKKETGEDHSDKEILAEIINEFYGRYHEGTKRTAP